ncbi:NADH-quinone oxidoreductase subunit NuoE family protein [Sphingomonas sp. LT1P40]|uniref:NADH-quinone oxidoreductase subunit NuoE family protein n=1 Tax=Alteristakelama amylovorans TaxID=3096166 RepID=UPI002FC8E36A
MAEILARHAPSQDALLPILHDVQARFGHVSIEAIHAIALHLNLSRAEVSGVVSFYRDFRRTADKRPTIRLCRAEACQARGGERVAEHAERAAGQRVRVEAVYCLGLCAAGPNAMIGDQLHARLDPARITALIDGL